MRRNTVLLAALALVLALSAACVAPVATPAPPTKTPKPTFTPTPAWTPTTQVFPTATPVPPTATPEATATPAPTEVPPTATPIPAPRLTANQTVNVRRGPGTNYQVIGSLSGGQSAEVTGKNPAGNWWQFDYSGQMGWVIGDLVTLSGDTGSIQVAQNIPAPPPPLTARPQPQPSRSRLRCRSRGMSSTSLSWGGATASRPATGSRGPSIRVDNRRTAIAWCSATRPTDPGSRNPKSAARMPAT